VVSSKEHSSFFLFFFFFFFFPSFYIRKLAKKIFKILAKFVNLKILEFWNFILPHHLVLQRVNRVQREAPLHGGLDGLVKCEESYYK